MSHLSFIIIWTNTLNLSYSEIILVLMYRTCTEEKENDI